MRRRAFLVAIGAAIGARPLRAQVASAARIGVLDPLPAAVTAPQMAQLREGLRREGLREGRDFVLEYRSAEGDFARLPALAAELVKLPVRVIVARNTPGVRAARAATASIPIVMADVGDPLGLGFVKSLGRPGANITGLSNATLELIQKRLEILREIRPGLKRLAVLSNAADQNTPLQLKELRAAARHLGIEERDFSANSEARLEAAFEEIARWRPDALLPLVQPLYRVFTPRVAAWATAERIPAIFARDGDAEQGALIVYAADLSDHYLRAAGYVQRILAGANPAEMAVERPTRYILAANLKTARAMKLEMPQPILLRADRVIE
jgi:putative ABC transport system substrate-binding protein